MRARSFKYERASKEKAAPCIHCVTTMEGIQNCRCARTRALPEMGKIRKYVELSSRGYENIRRAGEHEEVREGERLAEQVLAPVLLLSWK